MNYLWIAKWKGGKMEYGNGEWNFTVILKIKKKKIFLKKAKEKEFTVQC